MPTLDEAGCCPRAGADENRPSIDGSRFLSGAGTALAAPTASANIINPIPANCNLKSYITYFLFYQPMTSRPAVERLVRQHLGCHQIVAISVCRARTSVPVTCSVRARAKGNPLSMFFENICAGKRCCYIGEMRKEYVS